MGMGLLKRSLGNGPKSRRIREQQAAITDLQTALATAQMQVVLASGERDAAKAEVTRLQGDAEQLRETISALNGQLNAALDDTEAVVALEAKLSQQSAAMQEIQAKLDEALEKQAKRLSVPMREKEAEIGTLRGLLAAKNNEIELLKADLEQERKEHHRQKKATGTMWKFIHIRHRLDLPRAEQSIRAKLMEAEKQ